ncbi:MULTISPECIES: hypothetical protein [unclassified Chelatococcus]|uniref:hypothetical protein n=1 Tax=unclassified Chelatococcus TaxID=2638111 RepID=UPI001BCF753F|nr:MULTISPECIES: hypothetical protein [unclassified Chelatococcus]CAH1670481.1 conserved hypothetical protein [Hyphomicrobiales bacterium]MBS7738342.1 hypothetical protein [Chelatococcus sp. HY11]MBX3545870.1 hypothetical protein [Chelatococcus sp.]MCO5077312.1 hypothetical protein [Chelatococcus sp.]CAH1677289.1 conserved hypothetical protein [Hyphomicrobiales bacterium]
MASRATPAPSPVRFTVQPRCVPRKKAARRLHLSLAEFASVEPRLRARGFPTPDPDTGHYDLKAIDLWMDRQINLTEPSRMHDARECAFNLIDKL